MTVQKARLITISSSPRPGTPSKLLFPPPEVQSDKRTLSPRLVALIQSKLAKNDETSSVWATLMDSGPRSPLIQTSFAAVEEKPSATIKRKPVPALSRERSKRNLSALEEELEAMVLPLKVERKTRAMKKVDGDDTTPMSSPIPKSSFAASELTPIRTFPNAKRRPKNSVILPTFNGEYPQEVTTAPTTSISHHAMLEDSRLPLARAKSRAAMFEEPEKYRRSRNLLSPRISIFTAPIHSYHSSPELSSSARASRHMSTRPLTPSQIFDPSFQLFSNSFDRLSLAFYPSKRGTTILFSDTRAMQSNPEGFESILESSDTTPEIAFDYPENQRPEMTLQDFLAQKHAGHIWGTHAPCTTPSGRPSPLPLCARPDGVDIVLRRAENRRRRLWSWGRKRNKNLKVRRLGYD